MMGTWRWHRAPKGRVGASVGMGLGLEALEPREMLSATLLHSFADGVGGGSIFATGMTVANGQIYGTINQGTFETSTGVLYRMDTDGSDFTVLHEFGGTGDGRQPRGQMAVIGDRLYGATIRGGSSNFGAIYAINLDGSGYEVIKEFTNILTEGIQPSGGLVTDGTRLYGSSTLGIFALDPDGSDFTMLRALDANTDGTTIFGGMTLSNGRLYGGTFTGPGTGAGAAQGALVGIDTDGSDFQVLYALPSSATDGRGFQTRPAVLDGRLYAVTSSVTSNNVFDSFTLVSVNLNGTDPQVEKRFNLQTTGGPAFGDLIAANGRIYGNTANGGPSPSANIPSGILGTVFSFNPANDQLHTLFGFHFENEAPFGSSPRGEMAFDGTNLYVNTAADGANDRGTIVKVTAADPPANADMSVYVGLNEITSGQGTPALDFGTTPVLALAATRKFVITNTGSQTLNLGAMTLPSNFYTSFDGPAPTLPPGASDIVSISLLPVQNGTYSGDILIPNNSGSDPTPFRIPITGVVGTGQGGGGGGGGGGSALPDLSAQFTTLALGKVAITNQSRLVPGDKVSAVLRLTNSGSGAFAGGSIQVQVVLSPDQTLGNDVALQTLTVKVPRLLAGQSRDFKLSPILPRTLAAGSYSLIAVVDSGSAVQEASESNNTAVSATALPVVLQAGSVNNRQVKLGLQDDQGVLATFIVKNGRATVTRDPDTGVYDVTVTDAAPGSTLTITSKGGNITLGNVTLGNQASGFGTLTAKTAKLTGELTAAGGLAGITLREVDGAQITLGQTQGVNPAVALSLGPVRNTSLQSQRVIKSLKATGWVDDDSQADVLRAPVVQTMTIGGDFQADLLGVDDSGVQLGSAKIGGALSGAAWTLKGPAKSIAAAGAVNQLDLRSSGLIAKFTAAAMSGSRLFVGVNSGVSGLPDGSDDFLVANPSAPTLGALLVTGNFASSLVAAASVKSITLGGVQTQNGGNAFGLAGVKLKAVTINRGKLPDADRSGSVDAVTDGDFRVTPL